MPSTVPTPINHSFTAAPMGVTIDDARADRRYAPSFVRGARTRQGEVPGRPMVYAAFYHDDTIMGFGFPREEREALVASEPDKFLMPRPSDMRYRWVCVRLDAIDVEELRELLVDAWRMCVPKKVAAAYEGCPAPPPAGTSVRTICA